MLLAVFLAALTAAVFASCLRNGFVSLDDQAYVRFNSNVQQGLTWNAVKWAWGTTENDNWGPLARMSHELDVTLFHQQPAGHHLTSVAIHVLSTVLLFVLLQRITRAPWRSFAVALLFGLHPLRVESVAWVSERKDVLATFFWLVAIWFYARYAESQWPRAKYYYAAVIIAFVFGLLSKPMAVTLPFALLLLDYWPLHRWPETSAKRLAIEKIPFLALAAADGAVTFMAQHEGGAITSGDVLPLSMRAGNAVVSCARYLGKTFWPENLCALYPMPGWWPTSIILAAVLLLAVITGLALWKRRAFPPLLVGWFWFLGTLTPVIGMVQAGRQSMADRFTYIPSIGLWVAVVWSIERLLRKLPQQRAVGTGVLAAATMACIALTLHQIPFWHDSKALYQRALSVTSRNWVAATALADEYVRLGDIPDAVASYRESLQIHPRRSDTRYTLGAILMSRGLVEDAAKEFQTGLSLDPNDADLHKGMGAVFQAKSEWDRAIAEYTESVRLNPNDADSFSNLGNCYGMSGQTNDAIRCFETAVKLKPDSAQNHQELGVGLFHTGRMREAINEFTEALRLDPTDAQARQNLQAAMQRAAGPH